MPTRIGADQAETMIAAARRKAEALGAPMALAVTDAGGHLVALLRMDGSKLVSPELAWAKARSATLYGLPTSLLEQGTAHSPGLSALPHAVCAGGGVPIMAGGECLGAFAASGGTAAQDEEVALTAIAALQLD